MHSKPIYHYTKTRKQTSLTYIRMGIACWFYIAGLFAYETLFNKTVAHDFKSYWIIGFSTASLLLFYIAWWHRKNPATYEATITKERFIVNYPFYQDWSFDISIADIKCFEYRRTLGHAGSGRLEHGILMKDGSFHYLSKNYGNNLKHMFEAVKSINPEVTFPSKVNIQTFGFLGKDHKPK